MKKVILALVLLAAPPALAQTASPASKFAWQQDVGSLAAANALRYDVEIDGTVLPTPLAVTCTGTATPFDCEAPIPAVTPATHTVRIRAVDMTSPATPLFSPFSDPVSFTMRALPSKPLNVRIIPGG